MAKNTYKPRIVVPGETLTLQQKVERDLRISKAAKEQSEKLAARLKEQEDSINNTPDGDEDYDWEPAFSKIQVVVTDKRLLEKTTAAGIFIVERNDRLPYIECTIVAVGNNAGWNTEHTVKYQDFQVGDVVRVFEKHCNFYWLDGKEHSETFVLGRPYIATIEDKYIQAKRIPKRGSNVSS